MEQNGPKFRLKLNLFDAIVLVLAVLAVFLLLWVLKSPSSGKAGSTGSAAVRYTICFQRWEAGSEMVIHLGDSIADHIKNYEMGHVVSTETVPSKTLMVDQESGAFVRAELEGFEDVLVTVESACTVSDAAVTVGGGYELRVGAMGYYRGEGYMGSGPIMAIELEEAAG